MSKTAYLYKPKGKSKYPERVYVFLNWELWNTRNLAPMGLLKNSTPFLVREMTDWELDFVKGCPRLITIQYENWEGLISDDKTMDLPESHFEQLAELKLKYPLPPSNKKNNGKP